MKKTTIATCTLTAILALSTMSASADSKVSVGVGAGTLGAGVDAAWRFHDNFGVMASYHGGISIDGDHNTDDIGYKGDIDIQSGALKLAYHPFGGRFFVAAGAMLPDMTANVEGKAADGATYEYNGNTYSASDVGTLNGELTIADGVQPYLGVGWRSSHESGFGFYSELGVMSTDISVSLHSSKNFESHSEEFKREIRNEEKRLEKEVDDLKLYPVAQVGVTYTF